MLKKIAIIVLSIPMTMANWSFPNIFNPIAHESQVIDSGVDDAIYHPAEVAKEVMTKGGGDGVAEHSLNNQVKGDPQAGTQTVQWGDSSQGRATMNKDAQLVGTCARQIGTSYAPVLGQVADVNTIVKDSTQENYAEKHTCANAVTTSDVM